MCKIKNAAGVKEIARKKQSSQYGVEQIKYYAVSNRSPVFDCRTAEGKKILRYKVLQVK